MKVSQVFLFIFLLSGLFLCSCSYQRIPVGEIPAVAAVSESEKTVTRSAVQTMCDEQQWTPVESGPEVKRVRAVYAKLTKVVGVSPDYWPLYVVDAGEDVNASAVNKNSIVVYKQLVHKVANDAELATVLAHEVGHILAQHDNTVQEERSTWVEVTGAVLSTAASVGASLAGAGSAGSDLAGDLTSDATSVVGYGAFIGAYDREQEYEADRLGLVLMAKAGYDPAVAVQFWERAEEVFGEGGSWSFLSTHPDSEDRAEALRADLPKALEYYRK